MLIPEPGPAAPGVPPPEDPAALPLPPGPARLERYRYLLRFGLGGDKEAIIAELLARYGPVVHVPPYILMYGPKANRLLALSGPDRVETWPNPDFPTLASMDGEAHLRHRKLVMEAFLPRTLGQYLPALRELLHRRCRSWRDGLDVHPEMHDFSVQALARTMLGILPGSGEESRFLADYWTLIHRAGRTLVPWWKRRQVARARERMWALLRELIAARRASPGDDALSILVAASGRERPAGFDEEALVRHSYMLMDFGQGDIAIYLSTALAVLATRPDLQARLREERAERYSDAALLSLEAGLPFTWRLLLETERVYSPVTDIHRVARVDLAFEGYRLPRGSFLVSALDVLHRSPEYFQRPEVFDPERFAPPREEHKAPFTLMGFGAGRHMCVAAVFSRMLAALVLHELVARFALTAPEGASVPPVDYSGELQRPSRPIHIGLRRP